VVYRMAISSPPNEHEMHNISKIGAGRSKYIVAIGKSEHDDMLINS
jgi:hypothetical protein